MPVRTCVGCRVAGERSAMRRYVAVGGLLALDERKCLPGRGCWLHHDPACAALAIKRRAFGRALRTEVRVPEGLFDAPAGGSARVDT